MRHLRKLTLAALLLGFATLSTGCDRTTGALLVGTAIIATAIAVDSHDSHHRGHRGHYDRGHHGGGHYSHGGHHGGHGSYHYDYCD